MSDPLLMMGKRELSAVGVKITHSYDCPIDIKNNLHSL